MLFFKQRGTPSLNHNFKETVFHSFSEICRGSEGEGLSRRNFNQMNRYPETVDLSTSLGKPREGPCSLFLEPRQVYRLGGKRSATIRTARHDKTVVIHYTRAFEEFPWTTPLERGPRFPPFRYTNLTKASNTGIRSSAAELTRTAIRTIDNPLFLLLSFLYSLFRTMLDIGFIWHIEI